jgi:5-methyltetrahydropteroyltriglutamate--homocysteine methyltransferase
MPAIEPIIPGIYARSERLVQTTRDHDRDRVGDEQLIQDQTRDLENLLGVQTRAGFGLPSPGQITWQDHFRPFQAIVDNLETDTLTRFIDTNTFYRRPDVDGSPTLDRQGLPTFEDQALPDVGTAEGLYTLPSPTAWVTAARDEDGNYPDADLAQAFAEEIYPPILDTLAEPAGAIALADPWLARHPNPQALQGSLAEVAETADVDVHLQLAFQDAAPAIEAGLSAPVDVAIVDLHRSDRDVLEALPAGTDPGLGLVDARSSLVEREDLLVSTIDDAAQRSDAEEVYLAPNGSLQHVPETIARRKVRVLGEAARQATAKLGGDPR